MQTSARTVMRTPNDNYHLLSNQNGFVFHFNVMSILNQSSSDWIEAQIMETWNPKIISGASAKILCNLVLLLLHIWHHKKTHGWLCCWKSSLLVQKKHIPVNCTIISQLMTCTAGKKGFGTHTRGVWNYILELHTGWGLEAEIFHRLNLLWRKFWKPELMHR